nr:DUF6272 family protein [uncultured Propionivibrio sp.]
MPRTATWYRPAMSLKGPTARRCWPAWPNLRRSTRRSKAAYKTQLRRPREAGASSGAGLGLIDVARKSSLPLKATLSEIDENRAFFSLCAFI